MYSTLKRRGNGNGLCASRKRTSMSNIDNSKSRQESLLVFHGFMGNDYLSTFFKNRNATCSKALPKHSRFEKTFSMLGSHTYLNYKTFLRT